MVTDSILHKGIEIRIHSRWVKYCFSAFPTKSISDNKIGLELKRQKYTTTQCDLSNKCMAENHAFCQNILTDFQFKELRMAMGAS